MNSRPFVRAVLVGAGVMLAVLAAIFLIRHLIAAAPPESANEFDPAQFVQKGGPLDAPYIVTDYEVVDAMLAMADVRPNDMVVDLGSGDGRILIAAARTMGARGLGVDIDPARIRESNANAAAAGVSHRVAFRRQDLFDTPIANADVLTLYLTPEINVRLRPRILSEMRPGTRVVSHDFDMGNWQADQRQQIGTATIFMWIVPARIEGQWRLTSGGRTATLDLDQNYQELGGTATVDGEGKPIEQGRVAGRRIRFVADLGDGRRTFEGRISGDRIESIRTERPWQAVRAG